jgi:3-deoxy-D-manno-octulosonate 8-phosphate phosphatase (KDO 8-P phosphatase)
VGSEDAAVDDLPCLLDTARLTPELLMRAGAVRLLGLDVDGVLTDGTVWYGPTGETLKGFSILDGLGLRLLRDAGIGVAIITARQSTALRARMDDLGITDVCMGVRDKAGAWRTLLDSHGLGAAQGAYMGDDLIDLPVLRRAGLALSVPGAHPLLHRHAHWVSTRGGGHGAVREACELILAGHGALHRSLDQFVHD